MGDITPLVSVIIPVYNVEPYLHQCVDSVVNQTYKNLEILIIDDGSTDGCGKICDEYKSDGRVRVFHTENRGLSAARNLGLDNATGDYISFIDSDDWFELNAIQRTVGIAKETGADIVCFRSVREYANKSIVKHIKNDPSDDILIFSGKEIVHEFCERRLISTVVWNKVYRKKLFNTIRFPEGRNYEDAATVYKLLLIATQVVCTSEVFTHYRVRRGSITRSPCLKNIRDHWLACYERYENMLPISKEYGNCELEGCINVTGIMWRSYAGLTEQEKKDARPLLLEMQKFARQHRSEALRNRRISILNKILCICVITTNPIMMRVLFLITSTCRGLLLHGKAFE